VARPSDRDAIAALVALVDNKADAVARETVAAYVAPDEDDQADDEPKPGPKPARGR
jgi:hypothetical protein